MTTATANTAAAPSSDFLGRAGLYEVRRNEYGVFMEIRLDSRQALARGKTHEIVWIPDDVFDDFDWADKDVLALYHGCEVKDLEDMATGRAVERACLTLWIAEYWGLDNVL